MYNFWVQAYSTYKGLFYWLTWTSYITNTIIMPVLYVIIYSLLGQFTFNMEAARYYGLGILITQSAFIIISGITQGLTHDRDLGAISFLYMSPANRFVNYVSRGVLHFPNFLIVFTSSLIALWLFVGVDFGTMNWGPFVLAVLVMMASVTAFSEFLSIFSIIIRDWLNVMVVAVGLLFVFTGMIVPIDVFPSAVQVLTKMLPITNSLAVVRASFTGAPFSELYTGILYEAIIGLVFFTIGYFGFVYFEIVAKQKGVLDRDNV
jgi:ABC-type polysaccharide/polyol phosphate export permease